MLEYLRQLWEDESGPTMVEYALLLAIIALGGVVFWQSFGGTLGTAVDGGVQEVATTIGGE